MNLHYDSGTVQFSVVTPATFRSSLISPRLIRNVMQMSRKFLFGIVLREPERGMNGGLGVRCSFAISERDRSLSLFFPPDCGGYTDSEPGSD